MPVWRAGSELVPVASTSTMKPLCTVDRSDQLMPDDLKSPGSPPRGAAGVHAAWAIQNFNADRESGLAEVEVEMPGVALSLAFSAATTRLHVLVSPAS